MDKFSRYQSDFSIDPHIIDIARSVEKEIAPNLIPINDVVGINQAKVLRAFVKHRVTESHLWGSTGYGYDDIGREALDKIYADVFDCEAAYVRSQFVSGTHAIASCLLAVLQQGDELILASGTPYDTLHEVIGWTGKSKLSLLSKGVGVKTIPLKGDGCIDIDAVLDAISLKTKMVHLQRSRGYSWRRALSSEEISDTVQCIKERYPHVITFVDNCYGEFVENREPSFHRAVDLIAGSLIKNPGGGLALWGGYVAGKQELVSYVSEYCTAPGLGSHLGGTANVLRTYFQGLFLAPHTVGQALKGSIFTAALCNKLGLDTLPKVDESRFDIIQAIQFKSSDQLIHFCQGIQKASPIDSMALPEPGVLPGYSHRIIMAAGTFIQGGSLELTADAPIVEPYIGYVQGGLTYEHAQIGLLVAMNELVKRGLIKIRC